MSGEADPSGMPGAPGAALAFAPGEDVTVTVHLYDDSYQLDGTAVAGPVTVGPDDNYEYHIPLPKDLIGETRLVVKATTGSGDQTGYFLPVADVVDGVDVLVPPITRKSSFEFFVERAALQAWNADASTLPFSGAPDRAMLRAGVSALGLDYVPTSGNPAALGAAALAKLSVQYRSGERFWNEVVVPAGGSSDSFDVAWEDFRAQARAIVLAEDSAQTADTGQIAESYENAIDTYFDDLPNVAGWRVACGLVELQQARTFANAKLAGASLSTDALERYRASQGIELLTSHRRAWSRVSTQLAAIEGVNAPQDLTFVDDAEGAFQAIRNDPNTLDAGAAQNVFDIYSVQATAVAGIQGDAAQYITTYINAMALNQGDSGGATQNSYTSELGFTATIPIERQNMIDALTGPVTPATIESEHAALRQFIYSYLDGVFTNTVMEDDDPEVFDLLSCATYMAFVNDPSPTQ